MRALVFPSEEALRLALTAGVVPQALQSSPVRHARAADGTVSVCPEAPLPSQVKAQLLKAGVTEGPVPEQTAPGGSWSEAVRAQRAADPPPEAGAVLFLVPGEDRALLALAGEMLRLGCDRQELRLLERPGEALALLRVLSPPFYTLMAALDRVDGLRAFLPSPAGQERVWTELGYAHPLAANAKPAPGTLALIPGEGPWLLLAEGPWTDLYQRLDVPLSPPQPAWTPGAPAQRLAVPLRLARSARPQPPTLWVVREKAVAQVEALVKGLPEAALAPLSFAVVSRAGEAEPKVLLRARSGRDGALVVPGEAYAPLAQIPNLFAPYDCALEPPLRRDRLRELLAPDADLLTWLVPTQGGAFERESIPDASFSPLSEWVDYMVGSAAAALEPWVKGALFDFEPFRAAHPPQGTTEPEPTPKARREKPVTEPRRKPQPAPAEPPVAASAKPRGTLRQALARKPTAAPQELAAAEVELTGVEASFLTLDAPFDAPARTDLWRQMGGLNTSLSRAGEAGLCWGRALWETDGAEGAQLAREWAEAEAALLTAKPPLLTTLLARTAPSADETRALVAQLVAASLGDSGEVPPAELHRLQLWLDRHDANLDVRSFWLGRVALSQLAGGDRLGLVRARDRALSALHRGLSLERDVPRFLKVGGDRDGGREAGAAGRLSAQLELLLGRFQTMRRKRSEVEAAPKDTHAYVSLVFAYGFARLGNGVRARALRAAALEALNLKDPVHDLLSRAYGARIDQALEGRAPDTPLPAEVAGALNGLEPFLRYKVDRLRQSSTVLEPQERLDPLGGFLKTGADPRGQELANLRGMTDLDGLAQAVERLTAATAKGGAPPEEQARMLDGLMDFLPQLPEGRAVPLLAQMVQQVEGLPPPARARVLEDALKVAGHFNRVEWVRQLVGTLRELFAQMGQAQAAEAGPALAAALRSLRRVGLRDEAAGLLAAAASAANGQDTKAHLARLALAGGFAHLRQMDGAAPIFDRAFQRLGEETTPLSDRLALTKAIALALANAPVEYALAGLERLAQQLPFITDSFNTNSHFCLSMISFADALVLGHASEDLTMGETGRRFVEEDEYLVRRRIHRDVERA